MYCSAVTELTFVYITLLQKLLGGDRCLMDDDVCRHCHILCFVQKAGAILRVTWSHCFLFIGLSFCFPYVAQSIHGHFCHIPRICNLILLISVLCHLLNKKFRYHEKHSTSVVLS